MIDFIIAGVFYLTIMFVVFFTISFVTIGITYGTALFVRQFAHRAHPAHPALR